MNQTKSIMNKTQDYWHVKPVGHDSGSESAPLLSSGSHTSMEPVIFHESETSDLEMSPDAGSRYGSVDTNSYHSTMTIVPKRLPPLAQDNILIAPAPGKTCSPLVTAQERCCDISNMDMTLYNPRYNPSSTEGLSKDFGKSNSHNDPKHISQKDIRPKQSSIVTVFSVWNTILGSSLLTMPWGIGMAGFFPGIILVLLMSAVCLYTAHCLLLVHKYHGGREGIEVIQLSRVYLNRWAEYVAKIFSITVLVGATIAYWILMSNFLYNSVNYIYDDVIGGLQKPVPSNTSEYVPEVLCTKQAMLNGTSLIAAYADRSYGALGPIWDLYRTVPVFLGVLIFPLLNFKSPTFFTKFNSLGTVSILYLIIFVLVKSASWGINMSEADWQTSWTWAPTFPALSGMLALSFFIHNIIISIMQNNRDQSKNGRDLSIAFVLVTITYITIGVVFYACFPITKACIEDNLLNNFQKWDSMTVGARILLLFQLLTVYPLLAYMLRIQLLTSLCKTFSMGWIILVNVVLVSICILFAAFVPYIGTIIRYTGALSGLIYVFTLPSLLYLIILKKQKQLTFWRLFIHICIPIIGTANLVGQFFVHDH